MLAGTKTMTVLPVRDAERAKRFYTEKLGLRAGRTGVDGAPVVETEGAAIELMPWPNAAPSKHTVLSFEVPDVEREVMELEKKGVKFEDYDSPNLKTVKHIVTMGSEKAAWFEDPEGNILCVHKS